jgi:hypothetical protein
MNAAMSGLYVGNRLRAAIPYVISVIAIPIAWISGLGFALAVLIMSPKGKTGPKRTAHFALLMCLIWVCILATIIVQGNQERWYQNEYAYETIVQLSRYCSDYARNHGGSLPQKGTGKIYKHHSYKNGRWAIISYIQQQPWTGWPVSRILAYSEPLKRRRTLLYCELLGDRSYSYGLRIPWPVAERWRLVLMTDFSVELMKESEFRRQLKKEMGDAGESQGKR